MNRNGKLPLVGCLIALALLAMIVTAILFGILVIRIPFANEIMISTMSKIPLLNRIRKSDPGRGLRPPGWMKDPDDRLKWREQLDKVLGHYLRDSRLPAFNLDRVAHYYFVEDPREYWGLDELSSLAAPAPVCWMEYVFPGRIHSEIGDQEPNELGRADTGWLILQMAASEIVAEDLPADAKNIIVLQRFELYEKLGYVTGPEGIWTLAVNASGKIINRPYFQTWAARESLPELAFLQSGLHIPLLACSGAAVAGLREPVRDLWDSGAGKTRTREAS